MMLRAVKECNATAEEAKETAELAAKQAQEAKVAASEVKEALNSVRAEMKQIKEQLSSPPSSSQQHAVRDIDVINRTAVINGFEKYTKKEEMEEIINTVYGNISGLEQDGGYTKTWRTNEYFLKFQNCIKS